MEPGHRAERTFFLKGLSLHLLQTRLLEGKTYAPFYVLLECRRLGTWYTFSKGRHQKSAKRPN